MSKAHNTVLRQARSGRSAKQDRVGGLRSAQRGHSGGPARGASRPSGVVPHESHITDGTHRAVRLPGGGWRRLGKAEMALVTARFEARDYSG